MKCNRCKEYHQRLFKCRNDAKKGKNKIEYICGKCIFEIWGTHTHKINGRTGRK